MLKTASPKTKLIRSPKYRKFLSGLPCLKCKIEGYTQAAHLESFARGMKACDSTCAPLCTIHIGPDGQYILGCHENLDRWLDPRYWEENLERARNLQLHALWEQERFDEIDARVREF